MSTRCQIGIYESEKSEMKDYATLLYKHSDGYPKGVLPILEPFLKEFDKVRGMDDTEYMGAWLVHLFIAEHLEHTAKVYGSEKKDFIGHGICGDHGIHPDIEYFYRIHPCEVVVYKVEDPGSSATWEKVKTIQIGKIKVVKPVISEEVKR